MTWQARAVMDVKQEFVELAVQEGVNRRELCRRFGISPTMPARSSTATPTTHFDGVLIGANVHRRAELPRFGGFVALRGSPPVPPGRAGYFHLLAQMKGGKAKCLNASDPIELHGKKVRLMAAGSDPTAARPSKKTREKRGRLGATGQHPEATATPSSRSS